MPNDNKRTEELRRQYRDTLLAVANEIGASDRTPLNAVALGRIRQVLGVSGARMEEVHAPEHAVRPRVVDYVLALRRVMQEMVTLDTGDEHQAVISEIEASLNSLLQASL